MAMTSHTPATTAIFSERLWPGTSAWLAAPLTALGVAIVGVPFGARVAVVGAIVGLSLVVAGLILLSPRVQVSNGALRAGRARVELDILGPAEAFRGDEARVQRGTGLDARAFLLLRGWVDPVVRIPIDDPADPTPYWLISTRRPAQLMAALREDPSDDPRVT